MSGARSRRKGHRFEREVATAFRAACPGFDARRGLQSRDGSDAPDVIAPAPFWVECKRGKRTSHRAALRQAQEAAPRGSWLVAVCRDDREEATVSMPLSDFLELVEQWFILNNGGRIGDDR